jgi:hypothetical protein
MECAFGFRIVGSLSGPRRLVGAAAAMAAYAACDQRAEIEREAYLSAFQFGDEMRAFIDRGSTAGYAELCWSPWLWFDIDRPDALDAALRDARRLAASISQRYKLADDTLLLFFSGSKGFHVGLPTAPWLPEPSPTFHRVCRLFAEANAHTAGIEIDPAVYTNIQPFRAPNSRHPKTGLHKRRLSLDELMGLSLERIRELAAEPAPFDLPDAGGSADTTALLTADWQAAVEQVAKRCEAQAARRAATNGAPTLNRSTLEFIGNGACQGDRHRLLFSAAANFAEFDCPPALAHALLSEAGLDSGLSPKDVRRQIECGLAHGATATQPDLSPVLPMDTVDSNGSAGFDVSPTASNTPEPAIDPALAEKLRALWNGAGSEGSGR